MNFHAFKYPVSKRIKLLDHIKHIKLLEELLGGIDKYPITEEFSAPTRNK